MDDRVDQANRLREIQPNPGPFTGRLPSIEEGIGHYFRQIVPRPPPAAPPIPKLINPVYTELFLDGIPCREYNICDKPYTMQQPPNEGVATFSRQTISGKNLSYRLKVVQQPEKARACGSGPRSSADRRPVDPPPVVKLTIFQDGEDITFKYDAGFMLYASLDVARPIAQGRMHHGQIVPVLTGVAVAGVAYLDRPKAAGYFIFPDLSVRHEGWYRLRFHLFEHVKNAEDADKDRPFESVQPSTSEQPREPNQYEAMANRMYVYSTPFQVFSAKKFPGLNTSTELSKVVADQGCRVRIRREIRQRRKAKGKGDVEEEEQRKTSVHGTPEPVVAHERSLSREELSRKISVDTTHISSRRPSIEHSSTPTPIISAPTARSILTTSPISSLYTESRPFQQSTDMEQMSYMTPQPSAPISSYSQRTATPEASGLKLPPIASFLNPSTVQSPRQYSLPAPTSQKRSYSPRTYSQDLALKDGARPDSVPPAIATPQPSNYMSRVPQSTQQWVMNDHMSIAKGGPIIEADTEPHSDGESDDDSILNGPFVYRRADGTRSNKPLIGLRYSH